MTDAAKKRNKKKQERRIASVSFSKQKPLEREAFKVLQEFSKKPNPDDPERTMTIQQILVAGLLALGSIGEKLPEPERTLIIAPDDEVRDELVQFKEQVAEGLLHINRTLMDIQKQVKLMAEDGRLTVDQARQVVDVIDTQAITSEFAKNIQTSYKPGRKPKQ